MKATDLAPAIWSAIADLVRKEMPSRIVHIGPVVKRDEAKGHIWLNDFGATAIPLVTFDHTFDYFDTKATGAVLKRKISQTDAKIVVPRVGERVVVIDMLGNKRFPMCIGVVKSKAGYWQGDT